MCFRYEGTVTTRNSMKKKRHYSDGPYAGMDSRRKQEREDAGMISEDHGAIANMPQNVVMRQYPSMYEAEVFPHLNDTITGIDKQIHEDEGGMKRHRSKTKY